MEFNLHTHTIRCFHAEGEDEDYVKAAIDAGFEQLGFSDHIPYVFKDGYVSHMRMAPDEAGEYISSIKALREKYKDKIDIKIGFEMEWYPDLVDGEIEFLKTLDIDYLLLAQHFTKNECEPTSKYAGSKTISIATLDAYIKQLLDGARSGMFTYVCHPDLINFAGSKKIYEEKIGNMLRELKELDLPLEYNFLGYSESRWYPTDRFWKLAKSVGNRVVLGLDAHTPKAFEQRDLLDRAKSHLINDLQLVPENSIELIKPFK